MQGRLTLKSDHFVINGNHYHCSLRDAIYTANETKCDKIFIVGRGTHYKRISANEWIRVRGGIYTEVKKS